MRVFFIIFLSFHFFASCQKKQTLKLDDIKIVEKFEYNSQRNKITLKPLNSTFKNLLSKTILYSKNGDYWKDMNFNLYPLCLVKNKLVKVIFVLKKIHLKDGKLTELYLIKVGANNKVIDCKKIAKQESTANCENEFILIINKMIGEITQNETCEMGSQSDDENEDTTKTNSNKTVIVFNR